MFNALLDQGSELGLFQHYSGCILRGNLDLFEGWACQVGFKDAVLRYLARFSGAIDLLATPTEKLLQVSSDKFKYEKFDFKILAEILIATNGELGGGATVWFLRLAKQSSSSSVC